MKQHLKWKWNDNKSLKSELERAQECRIEYKKRLNNELFYNPHWHLGQSLTTQSFKIDKYNFSYYIDFGVFCETDIDLIFNSYFLIQGYGYLNRTCLYETKTIPGNDEINFISLEESKNLCEKHFIENFIKQFKG